MSGHGKREARQRVDAIAWRDRVIDDVREQDGAAASAYEVSVDLIIAAAEIIAAYMAAGESEISRTDLKRSGRRSGYEIDARRSNCCCAISRIAATSSAASIASYSGPSASCRLNAVRVTASTPREAAALWRSRRPAIR
jgi:hypothetical protein